MRYLGLALRQFFLESSSLGSRIRLYQPAKPKQISWWPNHLNLSSLRDQKKNLSQILSTPGPK